MPLSTRTELRAFGNLNPLEKAHFRSRLPFIIDVFTDKKGSLSERRSNGKRCHLDTLRYSR